MTNKLAELENVLQEKDRQVQKLTVSDHSFIPYVTDIKPLNRLHCLVLLYHCGASLQIILTPHNHCYHSTTSTLSTLKKRNLWTRLNYNDSGLEPFTNCYS
jgi:hypothetical protein